MTERQPQFLIQSAGVTADALPADEEFLQAFPRVMQSYHSAMKLARTQLEIWDDEYASTHDHSPNHHMECRLKRVDSLMEKLRRKHYEPTIDNVQRISDIAGIRVVCNYVNDIYQLQDQITHASCFRTIQEKDYIQQPKPNGYRSLHLVVGVMVTGSEGNLELPVEIQLRSIAMDLWASLEHELRYKSNRVFSPESEEKLRHCAETLATVDAEMQTLFLQGKSNPKSDNEA